MDGDPVNAVDPGGLRAPRSRPSGSELSRMNAKVWRLIIETVTRDQSGFRLAPGLSIPLPHTMASLHRTSLDMRTEMEHRSEPGNPESVEDLRCAIGSEHSWSSRYQSDDFWYGPRGAITLSLGCLLLKRLDLAPSANDNPVPAADLFVVDWEKVGALRMGPP